MIDWLLKSLLWLWNLLFGVRKMPAYIDVAAKNFKSYEKGDIIGIAIEGKQCSQSTSGNFICVIVSNATRDEVQHYIDDWKIDFQHTLVNQNDQGWRYRIEVDPIYISASNVGRGELKTSMRDHVENSEYWQGSSVVNFTSDSMTVDIPKNGTYQTDNGLSDDDYLKILKADFRDIFRVQLNISRYHLLPSEVNAIVSGGGSVTWTKAEALTKFIDKLEE
jgi:hypothetical protein